MVKKWMAKAANVKKAKPFEREELRVLCGRQMDEHAAFFAPFAILAMQRCYDRKIRLQVAEKIEFQLKSAR